MVILAFSGYWKKLSGCGKKRGGEEHQGGGAQGGVGAGSRTVRGMAPRILRDIFPGEPESRSHPE
jgi:hypothetical protein